MCKKNFPVPESESSYSHITASKLLWFTYMLLSLLPNTACRQSSKEERSLRPTPSFYRHHIKRFSLCSVLRCLDSSCSLILSARPSKPEEQNQLSGIFLLSMNQDTQSVSQCTWRHDLLLHSQNPKDQCGRLVL